ncbi:hypothetical protein ACIA5H_37500 [Nocardia sp. NPDC051900]|uniref:hypothetical protein n=1 Tax=Nocardia sp. NPDC051900 TaxID=3364326 RepID=UPI0037BDB18E
MSETWQCPDCETAITYDPDDAGSSTWTRGYIDGHQRGHAVHADVGHNPRVPSLSTDLSTTKPGDMT